MRSANRAADASIDIMESMATSATSTNLVSINPSLPKDIVFEIECANDDALEKLVDSSKEQQADWAKLPGASRADALYQWADAILARKSELAAAIVREVGKPIGEASGEVMRCVAILRYCAGEAVRATGEVVPALAGGTLQYWVRRPLGVVGLITPWNFPLAIPLWKAAPALAMGNAVVLKPAEESPWCASLLKETAPGVPFEILFGGPSIGKALVNHESIDAVSFTGSAEAGAHVASTCAKRNIKHQTEMGGKNPAIVLADADVEQAAKLVASGAMRFAGQKCTATSRAIVEKKVEGKFMDELRKAIAELPIGDPAEASTAVGPVISEDAQERIEAATRKAITLYRSRELPLDGFFVACQVVEAEEDSPLAQQEIFGPVLAILEANDLDHAIEIANNSPYGLSASLFTKDLPMALKYVDRIKAGMVRVNADTTGVDPHAPFGGVKGSSSHTREQGAAGKDFYSEIQTVQISS